MSLVNISNITILDNPSSFFDPFRFEITFEVLQELKEDLEFKLIYVGSAESEQYDQTLESVMVGPVPLGVNQFVFEAIAPLPNTLPKNDVIGVTVVLLTCSYKDNEFIRIGYYVNNEYLDEELKETPPATIMFERIQRCLLAEKPKVTRFTITWDEEQKDEVDDQVENMDIEPSVNYLVKSIQNQQQEPMMVMSTDE